MRNLNLRFDRYYIGQTYDGDFAKICGLLRIYELYMYKVGMERLESLQKYNNHNVTLQRI